MSEVIKKITEFQEHSKMLDEIFHCADIRDAAQNMLEDQLEADLRQLLLEEKTESWKIDSEGGLVYNNNDKVALYDGLTFRYNPYQE